MSKPDRTADEKNKRGILFPFTDASNRELAVGIGILVVLVVGAVVVRRSLADHGRAGYSLNPTHNRLSQGGEHITNNDL
jgi:hypothetical protein